MTILNELKRRNVFRVAVAYIVFSWLVLQVADIVFPGLNLPEWTISLVIVLLAIGAVPTLIFSWVYELTPEGVKRESDVRPEDSVTVHTARKLDIAVIALLVMAMGLFGYDRLRSDGASVESATSADVMATDRSGPLPRTESDPSTARIPAEPPDDRQSVAVLPFTNRSPEPDTAYFVDGIHDDLLTQLAKIGALKVISRTSVLEYRDTTKNLREIGQELGVSTIMEGAVQRAGDRVRINAQLIDAETDEHLWAETFDRELSAEGIFELQSEIARAIASALRATLTPQEEQRLDRRLTDNLEALAAYQRARRLDDQVAFQGDRNALLEVQRALELDPKFVAAWAFLARLKLGDWWAGGDDPGLLEEAWQAIEKGQAVDPSAPEIRVAEGYFHYWGHRRYEEALSVLEPVLGLAPNDADLHEVIGFVNRRAGRFDEALTHLLKAHELNPRGIATLYSVGETYMILRRGEEAKRHLENLERLAPTAARTYQLRGMVAHFQDGDLREAALNYSLAARNLEWLNESYWAYLLGSGQFEEALSVADSVEFAAFRNAVQSPELMRGITLSQMGDPDAGRAELELALMRFDENLAENPTHYGFLMARCRVLAYLGRTEAVDEACDRAETHRYRDAYDRNYQRLDMAAARAMAGLNDSAIELLEEILSEPSGPTRVAIRLDRRFEGLHEDPRWQALMEAGP